MTLKWRSKFMLHFFHVTTPGHTQKVVLRNFQGAGLKTIEIHGNVVEHRRSMTAPGLMDILRGEQISVLS